MVNALLYYRASIAPISALAPETLGLIRKSVEIAKIAKTAAASIATLPASNPKFPMAVLVNIGSPVTALASLPGVLALKPV